MSEASIYSDISKLRQEIKELKTLKERYINMITEINNFIHELELAMDCMYNAGVELKNNYDSATAREEAENIEATRELISSERSFAKNIVIINAKGEIGKIESKIKIKQSDIDDLYDELSSMEE